MARTILHYGTEYLGTPAQLGVIPEGVIIADPDTNTIKIGNGVAVGGVSVTVQAAVAWADITGKPANLDAISGDSTDFTYNAATNTLTVNGTVDTNTITANTYNFSGATVNNLDYSSLSNTPTTLAGYGITDAQSTTSGTLPSDRLPTVPTTKGGTGLTTIGTANQVLAVNGTGTALEFQDVASGSGTTINNNANNRIITGSNTADTLNADGNFTWNGTYLNVIGNIITNGTISGGNTTISGDLTFYNDAGSTVVGYIRNNNDRLEFNNRNGLRMFYFFDEGDQDIQVERALVIASNQYLSTPKIQQNQGATGGIEITGGEAGTVVIQTGSNNEINVSMGLVDITGNVTISGTMNGHTIPGGTGTIALTSDIPAGEFSFNITGDDSTVRTVQSGSTIGIVGGTGITTASDANGNITITGSGSTSIIKAYAHVDVSAPITASASFNVASVTSSATGKYDVTFTNALPNANYVVSLSVQTNVTSNHYTVCYYNRSTTGFQVQKFLNGVLDSGASGNFSFVIYQA